MKKLLLFALSLFLVSSAAHAQQTVLPCVQTTANGSPVNPCNPVTATNQLPVTIVGGISSGVNLGTSSSVTNPQRTGDITTGLYSDTSGTVEAACSGVNCLTANSTGVGIGTALPASKLDVWGVININGANAISYPVNDTTLGGSIAIGSSAMKGLPAAAAYGNTSIGYLSLGGLSGTSLTVAAVNNTSVGFQSLTANTSGSQMVAIGYNALVANTTGVNNVAVGWDAAAGVVSGNYNNAMGHDALGVANAGSHDNTCIGEGTCFQNGVAGALNNTTAVGSGALLKVTNDFNTAVGASALGNSGNTQSNTAIGIQAGQANTIGASNVFIGAAVGSVTCQSGNANILIGTGAAIDCAANNTANTINIGGAGSSWVLVTGTNTNTTANTIAHGVWNMPDIASTAAAQTGSVCRGTAGILTYDSSTTCLLSLEELKDKRGSITNALNIVNKLKPFWFTWKTDTPEYIGDKREQPGLGAHQVESVDTRLAGYGGDGKLHGVRYQELTAVLVAAVQEQQKEIEVTNGGFPWHKCFFDLLVCAN